MNATIAKQISASTTYSVANVWHTALEQVRARAVVMYMGIHHGVESGPYNEAVEAANAVPTLDTAFPQLSASLANRVWEDAFADMHNG